MEKTTIANASAKNSNEGVKSNLIIFNGKSFEQLEDEFEKIMAENGDPFDDWDIDPLVDDDTLPCIMSIRVIDLVDSDEVQFHLQFDDYYEADDFRSFFWQLISIYFSSECNLRVCPIIDGGEIAYVENELVIHIELFSANHKPKKPSRRG